MRINQKVVLLGCAIALLGCSLAVAQQASAPRAAAPQTSTPQASAPQTRTPPRESPNFTASEEAARQKVLMSERWRAARYQFNQWLSVQKAYNAKQIAQIQEQMRQEIERMSASQLEQFLVEMENKLKVLMGPEMSQARSWAGQFYTPQYQAKMARRAGFHDPLRMTAAQLSEAVSRFEAERSARNNAQAAFNETRQQEVARQRAQQDAQALASQRAVENASRDAAMSRSPYASPYAPQRVLQRYHTPSAVQGPNFSIGPWGGVWWSGF